MNEPTETPWGETYDDLVAAVLRDQSAPVVLQLAAVKYRLGRPEDLKALIVDAVALNEAERA